MAALSEDQGFRPPELADGQALHRLIAACPPLDVNSPYLYHLIGWHMPACSVVVPDPDRPGELMGAITGYSPAAQPEVLFIWQVAVHENGRGKGLGRRMLHHLVRRNPQCTVMHTTVGPGNEASHRMFARIAADMGAEKTVEPLINADSCGPGHEAEDLIVIKPLTIVNEL